MSARKKTSSRQTLMILEAMEANPQMATGRFNSPDGHLANERAWSELALRLNGEGLGPSKSWSKWHQTWKDLKNNTKKKATRLKMERQKTGGGVCNLPPLSANDERILALTGPEAVDGFPGEESIPPDSLRGMESIDRMFFAIDAIPVRQNIPSTSCMLPSPILSPYLFHNNPPSCISSSINSPTMFFDNNPTSSSMPPSTITPPPVFLNNATSSSMPPSTIPIPPVFQHATSSSMPPSTITIPPVFQHATTSSHMQPTPTPRPRIRPRKFSDFEEAVLENQKEMLDVEKQKVRVLEEILKALLEQGSK